MSKFKLLVSFALLAIIGTVLTICFVRRLEPAYEGKKLNAWLDEWEAGSRSSDRERSKHAEEAIRHMGAKAVPWFIDMLRTEDSPLNNNRKALWFERLFFKSQSQRGTFFVRQRGLCGIGILGVVGSAALPDLIAVLRQQINSNEHQLAAVAVAEMGPHALPAVPFLIENLNVTNSSVQFSAFRTLALLGPVAKSAAPAVRQKLDDADGAVRKMAAATLLLIEPSPESVPRLVQFVEDANIEVRVLAIVYLSSLKTNAMSAIPTLTIALGDSNKGIAFLARSAMERIAPDLAAPPTK